MGKSSKKPSKEISKRLKLYPRVRYEEIETKYPWLTVLLDTYNVLDIGISVELPIEEQRRKQKVACYKGCGNCCLNPDVPINELEIFGISWFFNEQQDISIKETLKNQLINHRLSTKCPFLFDNICSVYPMRPIACRMHFVFNKPCQPGEDTSKTRPFDHWIHSHELAELVAVTMLPYYGIIEKQKKIKAFNNGFVYAVSKPMHTLAWEKIII